MAIWQKGGEPDTSFDHFLAMFQRVFNHVPEGEEVGKRLMSLTEGQQSMVEFALIFHTLSSESKCNEPALKAAFWQGLNSNILAELACQDDETTLDSLIDMSIKSVNLLRDQHSRLGNIPAFGHSPAEPMQIDNI